MPEANPHRGELGITLAGEPLSLRPSFSALVRIEQAAGKSILALARAAVLGEGLTIREMAALFKHGADAFAEEYKTGDVFNEARIGDLILNEGLINSLAYASQFLELAVMGGAKPEKGGQEGNG